MPPRALPDHQRLDAETALKVRGTPAYRRVWREVASEFQLTETQFARTSIIILLRSLAKHEPKAIARAVKRANLQLSEAGMPTITAKEILNAEGLPEYGLLTWSEQESDEHSAEHEAQLPKFKRVIRAIFSPFWG
ncbi:hypothetical protein SAMN05880558_112140 [Aeromonas sp. RU39B]|uniref:hypothetical protein n=1 Tax=Aeromonas sp. RU39B TaxID=1907416 RepID=UPI0009566061|nr:hypothetical protein [Aeromonas sp. RU39B]SIR37793.1 hypothetical protein SAMN05880558_112140 [Aeromonas sp. RU39B]